MLTIIEDKAENAQAQKKLAGAFRQVADKTEEPSIGWQGGSTSTKVSWSSELQIWWAFLDDRDGIARYWRAFGTIEPRWGTTTSHAIPCEINSPFQGVSRRVAGAFAYDAKRRLVLVHRGRIGGGRIGIGKSLFVDNFDGGFETARDSDGEVEVALVGALDSARFCWQVAKFVYDVDRIKKLAGKPNSIEASVPKDYYQEFSGSKKYQTRGNVVADCDHGLVVDAMRRELEGENYQPGKDKFCDLYALTSKGEVQLLFEFKTSSSLSNVYSAIGQLFFRCAQWPKAKLVAVFPDTLSKSVIDRLWELGIHCVTYSWKGNRPQFRALKDVL